MEHYRFLVQPVKPFEPVRVKRPAEWLRFLVRFAFLGGMIMLWDEYKRMSHPWLCACFSMGHHGQPCDPSLFRPCPFHTGLYMLETSVMGMLFMMGLRLIQ